LCFHFNHGYVSVYCSFDEWFMSHLSHLSSHLSSITALLKSRSHTKSKYYIKTLILKGGQAPWSFATEHVTARSLTRQ
jgi:hypothetical protein